MIVETSHCGVSNGFTHGLVSLTERIHHQDRVHTRPYVMSHNNRVHTRPYVVSHNNRVYTRPYVMSQNNRVHTRPYVVSHLRCWHVPTIMHYELRIMNYEFHPNLNHRDSCTSEIDVLFLGSGSHPTLCYVAPLVLARTHNYAL